MNSYWVFLTTKLSSSVLHPLQLFNLLVALHQMRVILLVSMTFEDTSCLVVRLQRSHIVPRRFEDEARVEENFRAINSMFPVLLEDG